MNSPAPGWLPDPTGRHEYRYWDGSRWTDDVSDQGTISSDAYAGPTAAPAYGDPTATAPYDPTATAPYGDPTASYGSGPYPGAPQPQRPGTPTGLIIGLVVLVVALVGGLAFVVANQGDDDDTAGTTIGDSETTATTADDTGDDTDTSDTTESSTDIGDSSGSDDAMASVMASGLVTASNGVLTQDEAECLATGMIDEVGLDRLIEAGTEVSQNGNTNPFDVYTSDELEAISQVLVDCVPADKLDDLTSVFGDFVDEAAGGG